LADDDKRANFQAHMLQARVWQNSNYANTSRLYKKLAKITSCNLIQLIRMLHKNRNTNGKLFGFAFPTPTT